MYQADRPLPNNRHVHKSKEVHGDIHVICCIDVDTLLLQRFGPPLGELEKL